MYSLFWVAIHLWVVACRYMMAHATAVNALRWVLLQHREPQQYRGRGVSRPMAAPLAAAGGKGEPPLPQPPPASATWAHFHYTRYEGAETLAPGGALGFSLAVWL